MLIAACSWVVGIFAYGMIQQLMLGEQWGDRPMSDVGLAIVFVITVLVTLGLLVLFWWMQLTVEVRADGVYVNFRPLKQRIIRYDEIAQVEAMRYRPILQYGGWGIRRGRKGWAYNVSGSRGVRLDLVNGTHLLIGSQRATELAAAIETERKG